MSGQVIESTLVTRTLDLAARAVDLTNALSQASSLRGGLYELGEWLALEKLNRNQLHDCFEQAKGLVYANKEGEKFYDRVANARPNSNILPLSAQMSGSVGRLIVKDPNLSWMASTTACLYQFHNDRFISDVICMVIMLSDPENEGHSEYELRYRPKRVELKSVVDRIVLSVWSNVVNPGKDTEKLPAELEAVCEKGHHLNGDKLGLVIHQLKTPRERVIVVTKHLLKNLTLWLILHFHGRLIVTVSGKTLFDKSSGNAPRTIELKVQEFCSIEQDCSSEEDVFRLFIDVRGSLEEFLSGTYPSSFDMPETAKTRRHLYDVMRTYDLGAGVLSEAKKVTIRQTAQLIVKWLLSLPLTTPVDADFGFSVQSLDIDIYKKTEPDFPLGMVLGRSPSIINLDWGKTLQSSQPVVYVSTYEEDISGYNIESSDSEDHLLFAAPYVKTEFTGKDDFNPENVVSSLPILKDLMAGAMVECECPQCTYGDTSKLRGQATNQRAPHKLYFNYPGCKGYVAIASVLLLVAHAIADGFGAPDISGARDHEPVMKSVLAVFAELLQRKQIRWDTWFSTAACVYLGSPFVDRVMDIESAGTAHGAIQYGNAAVMAPWLDMTTAHEARRCFRFRMVQGKLGVMRESAGDIHFRGIPEHFAIVQAEHTEDTSSFSQRFTKWAEPLAGAVSVQEDDCTFDVEAMLVSADVDVYRLLLRIRSDTFARIIDPVDSMNWVVRTLPPVKCGHKENLERLQNPQDVIKMYDFDDLLGRWQNDDAPGRLDEDDAPGITIHMTSALQHDGKISVARALSVGYMTIVNNGDCCLPCAVTKARTMPLPEDDGRPLELTDRYIINVKHGSTQVARRSKRQIQDVN